MTAKLVSVVVLKERLINYQPSKTDPLFEESIYLIKLDLAHKTKNDLLAEIKQGLQSVELSYENEFGEHIQWKIFKIIDLFESIYNLDTTDLPNEVYSRHLALPANANPNDVLAMFYADYVWEDA